MIVNSHNPEFGFELISTIPYAYWLYCNRILKGTISGIDTEPLYYFSPYHKINTEPRSWYNVEKMDTPNRDIHKPMLDLRKFKAPPYKQIYKGKFNYDIVVCNRYNNEWPAVTELNKPINFFSFEFLDVLFKKHPDKKFVYLNIAGFTDLYDNSPPLPFNDYDFCKLYKNVDHIKDIYQGGSLNRLQLEIMAGSSLFYTLNGGYGILASYFGGINFIYTRPTADNTGRIRPTEVVTGDFNYYKHFGNSHIKHMKL